MKRSLQDPLPPNRERAAKGEKGDTNLQMCPVDSLTSKIIIV